MIDVRVLRGSDVREGSRRGKIEDVSLPWVRLNWEKTEGSESESVAMLRSDTRTETIEVLTVDRGWVPLKAILGVKEDKNVDTNKIKSLVEEVRGFLRLDDRRGDDDAREALYAEAAQEIEKEVFSEAGPAQTKANKTKAKKAASAAVDSDKDGKAKSYPADRTAQSPFKYSKKHGAGPRGRKVDYAGKWKCRCKKYHCACVSKNGARKTFEIGKSYKHAYNKQYRKWRSGAGKSSKALSAWRKAKKASKG